jgi:transcriptional regulator with XRE-family HTH domain
MSALKEMREKRGLTQASLSEKSGVNLRLIQAYEQEYKDIKRAQVQTVIQLADALRCDVRDII